MHGDISCCECRSCRCADSGDLAQMIRREPRHAVMHSIRTRENREVVTARDCGCSDGFYVDRRKRNGFTAKSAYVIAQSSRLRFGTCHEHCQTRQRRYDEWNHLSSRSRASAPRSSNRSASAIPKFSVAVAAPTMESRNIVLPSSDPTNPVSVNDASLSWA